MRYNYLKQSILLRMAVCFAVLCTCFGCATTNLSKITETAPTDSIIYTAIMHDLECGVAVGKAIRPGTSNTQFTADGGQSWNYGQNDTMEIFCVCDIDENTYFAAGKSVDILKTTDGGKTWTKLSGISGFKPKGISFVDETIGWCWTRSTLYTTADGAQSWNSITYPTDIPVIESAHLSASNYGFLCSFDGRLFRTVDGGVTWQPSAKLFEVSNGEPVSNKGFVPLIGKNNQTVAIACTGTDGIIAVGGTIKGKPAVKIWQSIDSGATWAEVCTSTVPSPVFSVTINRSHAINVYDITGVLTVYKLP